MKILFTRHALERARERGATPEEIKDVVCSGFSIEAKHGRMAMGKIYPYRRIRKGKYYQHKRIEAVFQTEGECIVVITVYVFYGKWE